MGKQKLQRPTEDAFTDTTRADRTDAVLPVPIQWCERTDLGFNIDLLRRSKSKSLKTKQIKDLIFGTEDQDLINKKYNGALDFIRFIADKVSKYGQIEVRLIKRYAVFQLAKNNCILCHMYFHEKGVYGPRKQYSYKYMYTTVLYPGLVNALKMEENVQTQTYKPPIVHEISYLESSSKQDQRLDISS